MTKVNEVYKCDVCGNIVEVRNEGAGDLECCAQPMTLQAVKTKDQGMEKHVPVIKKTDKGMIVKVGEVPHPMEKEHYIESIEMIVDGKVVRKNLKPGQKPETVFCDCVANAKVRSYCNVHGLWENK